MAITTVMKTRNSVRSRDCARQMFASDYKKYTSIFKTSLWLGA
jgi:hypothetical protein